MEEELQPDPSAPHGMSPEQLASIVAHTVGQHDGMTVEGCPTCAERDALWSAILAAESMIASSDRPVGMRLALTYGATSIERGCGSRLS